VANPIVNYYNAALVADLPIYQKMALLVLIKNMDFGTHETYIGQKLLAKQMGCHYNTAARAMDELEEKKLIELVGGHQVNPLSYHETKRFKILIQPLTLEVTAPAFSGYTPNFRGGQSIESKGLAGSLPKQNVNGGSDQTHSYTHTDAPAAKQSGESDKLETPIAPQVSQERRPHIVEPELSELIAVFSHAAKLDSPADGWAAAKDSLRSYSGPFSAARLALLMWWAFDVSKYWSKKENWHSLDIENFLGASATLDGQFRKFRRHDGLSKKFPTVQAVRDFYMPPAPDESAKAQADEVRATFVAMTKETDEVEGEGKISPEWAEIWKEVEDEQDSDR